MLRVRAPTPPPTKDFPSAALDELAETLKNNPDECKKIVRVLDADRTTALVRKLGPASFLKAQLVGAYIEDKDLVFDTPDLWKLWGALGIAERHIILCKCRGRRLKDREFRPRTCIHRERGVLDSHQALSSRDAAVLVCTKGRIFKNHLIFLRKKGRLRRRLDFFA